MKRVYYNLAVLVVMMPAFLCAQDDTEYTKIEYSEEKTSGFPGDVEKKETYNFSQTIQQSDDHSSRLVEELKEKEEKYRRKIEFFNEQLEKQQSRAAELEKNFQEQQALNQELRYALNKLQEEKNHQEEQAQNALKDESLYDDLYEAFQKNDYATYSACLATAANPDHLLEQTLHLALKARDNNTQELIFSLQQKFKKSQDYFRQKFDDIIMNESHGAQELLYWQVKFNKGKDQTVSVVGAKDPLKLVVDTIEYAINVKHDGATAAQLTQIRDTLAAKKNNSLSWQGNLDKVGIGAAIGVGLSVVGGGLLKHFGKL